MTPAKPVEIVTKRKPGSKPTPAEIASAARGGGSKQEAAAPRFAFADEVEPKTKPAAKKLDTVVSVTKSQAGHAKTEKDEPTDKPKPKK